METNSNLRRQCAQILEFPTRRQLKAREREREIKEQAESLYEYARWRRRRQATEQFAERPLSDEEWERVKKAEESGDLDDLIRLLIDLLPSEGGGAA